MLGQFGLVVERHEVLFSTPLVSITVSPLGRKLLYSILTLDSVYCIAQ